MNPSLPIIGTSGIFGGLILLAVVVLGFVVLWLVFRKRKHGKEGVDRAVGILEHMSFFKNQSGPFGSRMK